MLIAMSYNGYVLIAIVLGGLVGHFFSTWDTLSMDLEADVDGDAHLSDQYGLVRKGQPLDGGAYGNTSGACCD